MDKKLRTRTMHRLFCLALMLSLMLGLGCPVMAQTSTVDVSNWQELQAAISADTPITIKLIENIQSDAPLTIASGKTVTLDLAGHSLTRGLSAFSPQAFGHVIEVTGGSLTLKDSLSGGKITGGASIESSAGCPAAAAAISR